nr:hypothetical protein [Desulfobacterales bacterium]
MIENDLKKKRKVEEAHLVSDVITKAIEPAYNFYGIDSQKVKEKAGALLGLLVFYVVYTMCYGFAIFYIFEGLGFSMKRPKVKREV